jgi:hypothetical protein
VVVRRWTFERQGLERTPQVTGAHLWKGFREFSWDPG